MPWLIPDAHAQAVEAAREIVLRRLDRSAAPRAALAELLERKEVDPRVATEVLDRLEAAGVIDDTAYAARLARTRFAEKGTARRAIAEELRRKGLGESDVAQALDQISADGSTKVDLPKKPVPSAHDKHLVYSTSADGISTVTAFSEKDLKPSGS